MYDIKNIINNKYMNYIQILFKFVKVKNKNKNIFKLKKITFLYIYIDKLMICV